LNKHQLSGILCTLQLERKDRVDPQRSVLGSYTQGSFSNHLLHLLVAAVGLKEPCNKCQKLQQGIGQ
jgi:hypothetical protein